MGATKLRLRSERSRQIRRCRSSFRALLRIKAGMACRGFRGLRLSAVRRLVPSQTLVPDRAATRSRLSQRLVRTGPGFPAAAAPGTGNYIFEEGAGARALLRWISLRPGHRAGAGFA